MSDCTECYRLAALARQRQDEAWQLNVKCQILQAEIDKLREAAAETEALLHRGSEPLDPEREPLPFVAVGQTWRNTKTSQNYVVINVGALCKFDEWIETVSYSKFLDGRVFTRRITDFYANFEPVEVGQ